VFKLKLTLEDGSEFIGQSFGKLTETEGEVVFNTGMVGYTEALTDPSYRGQILVMTYPMVGNYGVPLDEKSESSPLLSKYFESSHIQAKALIVSEYCEEYSHWNAAKSLGEWLNEHEIPGIFGIDTRRLTTLLREKGAMLGKIRAIVNDKKEPYYDPNKDNLVEQVSCRDVITYKAGKKTVVLVDCGVKENIIRSFLKRNITVVRVPWDYNFFEDKSIKYNGIFFSNGPGDPVMASATIAHMRRALTRQSKPVFGICLGAQIMALGAGAKTYKLKYGHRSQNQPCIDTETGRCYMTTQNHGFAIDTKTLPNDFKVWFTNANDATVEGIKHKTKPFFAVQFHPEACPGPTDAGYLFDKFSELL
jgi:carbamoyl-phosphate synthase small subunit